MGGSGGKGEGEGGEGEGRVVEEGEVSAGGGGEEVSMVLQ